MKTLLTFLILLIHTEFSANQQNLYSTDRLEKLAIEIKQAELFEFVIEFIKDTEGFRSTRYDDGGYQAIGYGQRTRYFENIPDTISELFADSILRISFNRHIEKNVIPNYPGLTFNQKLSIGLMSYKIGIGRVLNNQIVVFNDNKYYLCVDRFMRFASTPGHKKCRIFEIRLFYINENIKSRRMV